MRASRAASLVLVPFASAALAVPPTVKVPAEVKGEPGAFVVIEAQTEGKSVKFVTLDPGLNVFPSRLLSDPKSTVVTGSAGRYRVLAYSGNADGPSEPAITVVVIGGVPPKPPVPPEPTPPTPPEPSPAPIPEVGLRVLVVYETADIARYPLGQHAILFGRTVREALDAKCVLGPDGRTREYRIWDKDVDARAESTLWQKAFARPRTATPWVIVSNGRSGFEGSLPATADEFLSLLKRFEN